MNKRKLVNSIELWRIGRFNFGLNLRREACLPACLSTYFSESQVFRDAQDETSEWFQGMELTLCVSSEKKIVTTHDLTILDYGRVLFQGQAIRSLREFWRSVLQSFRIVWMLIVSSTKCKNSIYHCRVYTVGTKPQEKGSIVHTLKSPPQLNS